VFGIDIRISGKSRVIGYRAPERRGGNKDSGILVGDSGRGWGRNPSLITVLLLSGLWEWTGGRIRCVLGTSVIVRVAIVFPDRWGVHDNRSHWGGNGGRRKGGEREGNAVVMALKKACGGEPKGSKGGQGCAMTLKRRYINNDNGPSSKKDKERAILDSGTTTTESGEREPRP